MSLLVHHIFAIWSICRHVWGYMSEIVSCNFYFVAGDIDY